MTKIAPSMRKVKKGAFWCKYDQNQINNKEVIGAFRDILNI